MAPQSMRMVGGLAFLAAVLAASAGALAQEVGSAGAVNPAASGTPPGAGTRTLSLGARVIHRERIRTTASGSVQLIFIDKTTMSIGPNSDIVIDEFVYDPRAGTGRMTASMAKGVLRFVGGNTSHTGGATVNTPVATLGVRGGTVTIKHDAQTDAVLHYGYMTARALASSITEVIRRAGWGVTIASPTQTPIVRQFSGAEVAALRQATGSKGGQTGGAGNRVTQAAVARADIAGAQILSRITPATGGLQQDNLGFGRSRSDASTVSDIQSAVQNVRQQVITQNGQQAAVIAAAQNAGPANARVFAFTTAPDPALNSSIPYVLGSAVASGGVSVTPVMGAQATNANGAATGAARTLQVGFGVNGAGDAQTSNIMVSTGEVVTGANGAATTFSGDFRSTSRKAATLDPSRASGTIASIPGSVTNGAGGLPSSLNVNQNTLQPDGTVVANTAFARPGGNAENQNYAFQQTFTRSTAAATLGQNRPAETLSGFAGGLVRTVTAATNQPIELAQPIVGTTALQLDPGDSRVQLNIAGTVVRQGQTPGGALQTANIQIGNTTAGQPARSAYVDTANFGAIEAVTTSSSGAQTPVSTANGFALAGDKSLMVSSGATNVASAFPGVTFCNCEFTRWGFWSQETQQSGFSDRVHLGTWVAGQVSPDADVKAQTGSATYTGHVIASIRSGQSEYVAAGNLSNAVNFGAGTIASTVNNLDGRTYSGALTIGTAASAAGFGGTLAGTGNASMVMGGSFYRGATSPVGEMGGNVLISGPNSYAGSGIFAGARQ